jgi:hypothetical protein
MSSPSGKAQLLSDTTTKAKLGALAKRQNQLNNPVRKERWFRKAHQHEKKDFTNR